MTYRSALGQLGENLACQYLSDKKYKIIERNFRKKWGEIDIVARAPNRTLVFVEVKTRSADAAAEISPEDQLTLAKLKKLRRAASLYAGKREDLIDGHRGWRIDLIAITLSNNKPQINHYENI